MIARTTPSANRKPPDYGWFWFTDDVAERIKEVGTLAFAVYVIFTRHAGKDWTCYPGQDRIANAIGCKSRAVQLAVARLVKAQWIQVKRGAMIKGKWYPRRNTYTLLPLPPKATSARECALDGHAHSATSPTRTHVRVGDVAECVTNAHESAAQKPEVDQQDQEQGDPGKVRADHLCFSCSWDAHARARVLHICREKFSSGPSPVFPGPMLVADRVFLLKVGALLAAGKVSEASVDSACEAIRKSTNPIANRGGYFFTVLADIIGNGDMTLQQLLVKVHVPEDLHELRSKELKSCIR